MSNKEQQDAGRLAGRTVLVTGAAGGIGSTTAAALGRAGARVLVHARTPAAAAAAVQRLIDGGAGGVSGFVPVEGDLGSLAGVGELAGRVRDLAPEGLDVLVNNAGAAFAERHLSPDGVERTIAVNHVAVAALTEDLLDLLRRAAEAAGTPSRVVNLSSTVEKRGAPITDWTYRGGYKQLQAYSDSKLLNLAYTYAVARRLAGSGITVNAANPGAVGTAFGAKAGGLLKVMMIAGKPFMASPDKGARTSIHLASDPGLAGATGGYYSAAEPDTSSAQSKDTTFGDQVYNRTQALLQGSRA